jgi:hypothetical protein
MIILLFQNQNKIKITIKEEIDDNHHLDIQIVNAHTACYPSLSTPTPTPKKQQQKQVDVI